MYHSFLIHLSADGRLGHFHVLAILSSAAMNIGVHVSLSILVSSVCVPSSGISGSPWNFLKLILFLFFWVSYFPFLFSSITYFTCLKFNFLFMIFTYYLFFIYWPNCMWNLRSLTRAWTHAPLQWKHRAPATGPPGSPLLQVLEAFVRLVFWITWRLCWSLPCMFSRFSG